MPKSNPHTECLKCLGEEHQKETLCIYKNVHLRTLKHCEQQFRILCMEAALCPHLTWGQQTLVQLFLVYSALMLMVCDLVPNRQWHQDGAEHKMGQAQICVTGPQEAEMSGTGP